MAAIKRTCLCLLLLIATSTADETNIKETLSNTTEPALLTAASATEKATAALIIAGSLAWTLFRAIGAGVYAVLSTMTWPVLSMLGYMWRILFVRPWELFMSFVHVVYPVALFCLAAVLCGTVIGGCAGFAAEAIAWFSITATWGRSAFPKRRQQLRIQDGDHRLELEDVYQHERIEDDDDDDDSNIPSDDIVYDWDTKGKTPMARLDSLRHRSSRQHQQREDDMYDDWSWEDENEQDSVDNTSPRRRQHTPAPASSTRVVR